MPVPGACPPYPLAERLLRAQEAAFAERIAGLDRWSEALAAIPAAAPAPAPRWGQDWFPGLDAAMAYAMVRARRPARIVEVGSGHSTRFLARAAADGGLAAAITAIDPAPRAALEGLAGIRLLRTTVQRAGREPFAALGPGDLLFIDSSHLLVEGSDVDFLFSEIVPALPAGALLHVHDVFLPDGYPADWAWRGYNEQSLAAALMLSGAWRPLFASHYARTRMAGRLGTGAAGRLVLSPGARESSLWLEKVHGPLAQI